MLTKEHEKVRELFRNRPALAVELVRDVLGVALPSFTEVRLGQTDLTEAQPAAWHADVVVELREGERARAAVIVEIQRSIDPRKRFSWPVYVASVRAALECPVVLLVVATDRAVARWARRAIQLGPDASVTPRVLSPEMIPAVESVEDARRDPELAVLSAVAHARTEREHAVTVAAAHGLDSVVDEERRAGYFFFMAGAVSQVMKRWLEEHMGEFRGLSELQQRIEAGEARGEVRGRVQAVLRVLAVRGIVLPEDRRSEILACVDPGVLDRWLERAATAERIEDVLD